MVLVFSFVSTVFAGEQPKTSIDYKQAQDVADLYGDCVYLYQSSGLSYEQFDQMFTKATLAKNRFLSKYEKDISIDLLIAFQKVDRSFVDARGLWKDYIDYRYINKSTYTEGLMASYPKLKEVHREGLFGVYDTGKMAPIVAQYCVEYTENLKKAITAAQSTPPTVTTDTTSKPVEKI